MRNFRRNLELISVQVVALLTAAMGVVNVISAVKPSLPARLRLLSEYSPLTIGREGHLAAALAGFALLLLSRSLWRRKQVGWILTVGTLLLSAAVHLLKGLDYEEASLAGALALLLIYLRPHFHARSDPPSIRQGLQLLAGSLVFTLAYGVLGFYLLDRHYSVNFGFTAAFRQTITMFTQFYDPGLQPVTGYGRYFADSIYVVAAVTFGYALLMLLRPVLARSHGMAEQRGRAQQVVTTYGCTALARFALLPDKLFYFSPAGSLISYIVENRVAIALGDPIGPPQDFLPALQGFRAMCLSSDWQPVFYQVLPEHLQEYARLGFATIMIGQEAIIDLAAFTLEGSANKSIRNSHTKMLRSGYRSEVIQPPHSTRMLHELEAISDDWLASKHASEMRFSLGWFDIDYLNSCPILLVRDAEGFIDAFANIVIENNCKDVAVDLMRHHRFSEKGIMDFLFISLFEWAKAQGYVGFDIGLSALSKPERTGQEAAPQRILDYAYANLNSFYNFKGLHAFKEKFHPQWSPRYLVYPGMSSLPSVIPALIQANRGTSIWREVLGLQRTTT
jgi:phosphatidylglycerol lysyltransferase